MARFESIHTLDGQIHSTVNVSDTVGVAGRNLRGDVLLIQVLFKYIAEGLDKRAIGLGPEYNVPEATGHMDADTYSAICEFQIAHRNHLLINTFDGVIHPARYKGRKLILFGRPLMTITRLHIIAVDASLIRGDGPFPLTLARMNSELASYLDSSLFQA